MEKYKILGVGHPRTGTGYSSKLLNTFGFDIGHEKLKSDGIVAWPLSIPTNLFKHGIPWVTPKKDYENVYFETIIYNTRNPINSIPSIVFTETQSIKDRQTIVDFSFTENEVEKAIISIVTFDKIINERFPKLFQFRVEDGHDKLHKFLSSKYEISNNYTLPSSNYNSRKNRIGTVNYDIVRPKFREMINQYCDKYGYEKIY
jgi:hypothetical protein